MQNHLKHVLTISSLIILTAACTDKTELNIARQALGGGQSVQNHVTLSTINNYIYGIKGVPATKSATVSIEPILNGTDTVMYIVNYEDGWEVLSSDMRLSKTLIKSDSGQMTLDELESNPAIVDYFSKLQDGISSIKNDDSFVPPVEVHDSWLELFPVDSIKQLVDVLLYTDTTIISQKYQDHMMGTKWGQNYPWNQYAPYTSSARTSHCYTGCTMVAAAQVLYFLHGKYGVPQCTYGKAECDAYVPASGPLTLNSSDASFSDYGDHWSVMPLTSNITTGADYVSALMVHLGYLFQAKYRGSQTGAWPHRAVDFFPSQFSISCENMDVRDYNYDVFMDVLENEVYENQIPVIFVTYEDANYTSGHSLVIDGYNHSKKLFTHHYAVYETPSDGLIGIGQLPTRYYTQTTTEESYFVAINWGWNGHMDQTSTGETIWYNLYSSWIAGGYEFQYPFECVHSFRPIE